MFGVILFVIIALVFGYFSTQNSIPISLTFGDRIIPDVPLYLILGVTLLIGLLYSWLVSLVNSWFFARSLRGKEHTISNVKKENDTISQRLVELEMENTRLRAELDKQADK